MSTIPPQLRWMCRRGMLELDILLGDFLEEVFLTLSPEDQNLFIQLIQEANDQSLYLWLMEKEEAPIVFEKMIKRIQYHAKTRHHF